MNSIRIVWVLATLVAGSLSAQTSEDLPPAAELGLKSEAAVAAYNQLVTVRSELQTQAATEKAERDRSLSARLTAAQREVLDRALERRAIVRQIRRDQLGSGETAALRTVEGETRAQKNGAAARTTERDLLDTLTRRVGLTVTEARQVMGVLDGFESGERTQIRRWRSEKARVIEAIANDYRADGISGASGSDSSAATDEEIDILTGAIRLGGQLAGTSEGRQGSDDSEGS